MATAIPDSVVQRKKVHFSHDKEAFSGNTDIRKILFAHRNDYCIQMLLSGKTEVASPERLSGHNQSRFRTLDTIEFPLRILYFTPNFTDMLFEVIAKCSPIKPSYMSCLQQTIPYVHRTTTDSVKLCKIVATYSNLYLFLQLKFMGLPSTCTFQTPLFLWFQTSSFIFHCFLFLCFPIQHHHYFRLYCYYC